MGLCNWDLRTEVLLDCLAVSKDVYFVGPTLRTCFTLRVMSLLLFLLSTDLSSLSASLMYFPSRYTCHRREFPLVSALLDLALPRMAAPCNSDFKIVIFFCFLVGLRTRGKRKVSLFLPEYNSACLQLPFSECNQCRINI